MTEVVQYFRLFANCILVKGFLRSTICDLERGEIHLVPNDLQSLLQECSIRTLAEVKMDFDSEDHTTIDEYISFLQEKELGRFYEKEELALFPALNLDFALPTIINNAIIDIGETVHEYSSVIQELDTLGCTTVQIRIFISISPLRLTSLLNQFEGSRIKSIELFVKQSLEMEEAFLQELLVSFPRLVAIVVHSASCQGTKSDGASGVPIVYTLEQLSDESHCGYINPSYFSATIEHFTESQVANTCLNQKLSIDQYGFIKNCPAMAASFGHISTTSLLAVAANTSYRANWLISKDQISVCKQCEFRYVCSDCRAFLSDPLDPYSKPKKCHYDPFTAEWASA